MTAELLDEGPDNPEKCFIAWLSPLRRTANTRRADDPLPFTLVTHLGGPESVQLSNADALISVHTLCDKSLGEDNAADESDMTHRRLLLQARYLEDVDLADGRIATIDYLDVLQEPSRQPYGDDQIIRYVGRYVLGLSYANVL